MRWLSFCRARIKTVCSSYQQRICINIFTPLAFKLWPMTHSKKYILHCDPVYIKALYITKTTISWRHTLTLLCVMHSDFYCSVSQATKLIHDLLISLGSHFCLHPSQLPAALANPILWWTYNLTVLCNERLAIFQKFSGVKSSLSPFPTLVRWKHWSLFVLKQFQVTEVFQQQNKKLLYTLYQWPYSNFHQVSQ
jgi:hypothetical protein